MDHGTLVFRTDEGTKLGGALGETPVALEADGVDGASGIAWSVVVKGKAVAFTGTEEILDSASLYLFPWQAGKEDHFVRITPDTITGRRFLGNAAAHVVDAAERRGAVLPRVGMTARSHTSSSTGAFTPAEVISTYTMGVRGPGASLRGTTNSHREPGTSPNLDIPVRTAL